METENIGKAQEAIIEQVELLKNGRITDDEMLSAKLAVKNAYISALDSLVSVQAFYIQSILRTEHLSPEEAADIVESITRDEIIDLAASMQLDTVFSLVGNE